MITFKSTHSPISNFTIYGERHSGTKFLHKLITKYYSLPIVWDFGWKHFFGHYNNKIIEHGHSTLFLGIVRNPYDWVMAMHKKPYHVPHKISHSLESLITTEWKSVDKFGNEKMDLYGNYEDRNYLTQQPYKNIFELRKYKNTYLYEYMPKIASHYYFMTYDELITQTNRLLENISDLFKIKAMVIKNSKPLPHIKDPYPIDHKTISIINNSLNWDMENKLGFYVKN